MKPPQVIRREYYGTLKENILGLGGILGAVGLCLYGLFAFPLLDQNDSVIWKVPAAAYVASLALVLANQRRLFPWGDRLPFIKWQAVVALPVVPAAAALGLVLVSNALLDRGQPQERLFLIAKHPDRTSFWLVPPDHPDSRHLDLYVRRPSAEMVAGRLVRVRVKPGFFHHAWVDSYQLEPRDVRAY